MKQKAFALPFAMQEASACSRPGSYLHLKGRGMTAPSTHLARLSALLELTRSGSIAWDQTGTQIALDALLLLEFPFAFTFTTFVELPEFAEAVHQLARAPHNSGHPIILFFLFVPSDRYHLIVVPMVHCEPDLFVEQLQDGRHGSGCR